MSTIKGTVPTDDLEDLFENAPCGYLSLQPDGRIIKCNTTLANWLGVPAEQILGKRLRDLLNVAGRIFYETHFAPLLRMQGYFNEVALDLVTADGGMKNVLANANERRTESGELMFIRVTLFQATERRRYERELVDARAAADAAGVAVQANLDLERGNAELREQFIAVLGHDLRNPLAAINAAVRILRKEVQTDKSSSVLDMMQGSVVRMSGLIDNVMDFTRGRLGGGIAVHKTDMETLAAVLEHVIDELRSANSASIIETDIMLQGMVFCDAGRIGQLLSNLLGNAISHGAAELPILVSASIRDGVFEIYVANGGKRIAEAAQGRLFQPFFRGDAGPNQQGLGLGLHIASEIARAHDGRIVVSSSDEETRFTFSMPSARTRV